MPTDAGSRRIRPTATPPAPSLPRPSRIVQLLYLFLMTLPMKLLGAIISLTEGIIYTGYSEAPRIWGISPQQDQGWGGLLMWLPGGLVLWASMIYIFVQWVREERASSEAEVARVMASQSGGAPLPADVPPLRLLKP